MSQRISKVDKEECLPFEFDLSESENQNEAYLPKQKKIRKRSKPAQNDKKCASKKSRKPKTCFIGLKSSRS